MLDRVPTPRTAHARWMALLLLSVLASTSRARTIEITPVAGYRIGGGNVNTNAQGEFEPGDGFELDDSFSFGLHVAWLLTDVQLELIYARQDTRRREDEVGGLPTHDLAIESWQVGASWSFRDESARVRPLVGAAIGLTRLLPDAPALSDETHFSFSLGVGARVRLTDSVGLRLESRWFAAVLGSGDDQYSGPGAMGPGTSQLLSQLDLRAGLSLRF
jgi:opacity protein-like surface antigen